MHASKTPTYKSNKINFEKKYFLKITEYLTPLFEGEKQREIVRERRYNVCAHSRVYVVYICSNNGGQRLVSVVRQGLFELGAH